MKKAISLILICCMVVLMLPCTPAEAVPEPASVPTIEEILNDYHAKAFAAQTTGETASTSAYSRSVGSNEASLEQETVNTLTAAGYEAYNLTGDNYDSLESQLKTDFSEMGLDPDSSYIIIISGEDQPTAEISPITPPGDTDICGIGDGGILPPIHEYDPDQPTGGESFYYTYNGTTFLMRYLTIIATNSNGMVKEANYILQPTYWLENTFRNIFNTAVIAFLDEVTGYVNLGTIISLMVESSEDPNLQELDPGALTIIARASWTCELIQIWNEADDCWDTSQCSEYVVEQSYCTGFLTDPDTGVGIEYAGNRSFFTIYSPKYYDTATRKREAVEAYDRYSISLDYVYSVSFYLGSESGDVIYSSTDQPLFILQRSYDFPLHSNS